MLRFRVRHLLVLMTLTSLVLLTYVSGYFFDAACLLAGLTLWYLLYGVECFINGAGMGSPGPSWQMPFREWWRELRWSLPVLGKKYRLADTLGDQKWADMLPGAGHFLQMCVLLPLAPWIIYRVFYH